MAPTASLNGKGLEWLRTSVQAFHRFGLADAIFAAFHPGHG